MVPELMGMHDVPAREFVKKSAVRPTGYFASHKSQAMLQFESQLERDFLYVTEVLASVLSVSSQPITLRYRLNGRWRYYTPDFLVTTRRRRVIVEVKPANKLDDEWLTKEQIFQRHFADHEEEYRIVTDEWIRREPRLSNVRLVRAERYRRVPPEFFMALCTLLAGDKSLPIQSVLEQTRDVGSDMAVRWVRALIYYGALGVDLDEPITERSVLHLMKSGGME